MPSNSDLIVEISATTALLQQQLIRAERQVENFERSTNRQLRQVDGNFDRVGKNAAKLKESFNFVKGAAVGALTSFATGTLVDLARKSLDAGSALAEVSQQLGVTTDDLQTYRFIATQVGISQEEIESGLQKLTKTIGQAASGNKKAATAFNELGVDIKKADGSLKSAGEVIPLIADALEKIPDPAKRAAAEVALFGRTGQQLDTLLSGGSKAINSLAQEYEKLGIKLNPEQIARLDKAADALAKLKLELEGRITLFFAENIDDVRKFADDVGELTRQFLALIKAGDKVGDFLNAVDKKLGDVAFGIRRAVGLDKAIVPAVIRQPAAQASDFIGAKPGALAAPKKAPFRGLRAGGGSFGFGGALALSGIDLGAVIDAQSANSLAPLTVDIGKFAQLFEDITDDAERIKALNLFDVQNRQDSDNRDLDLDLQKIEVAQQARLDDQEELLERRAQNERELSGLFIDLFEGGTKRVFANFKQIGLQAVADIAARLILGGGNSGGGGGGGLLGSLFGGGGGDGGGGLLASLFGGGRANGGDIVPGKFYLTGENGPELIAPRLPATVLNNRALSALGGGGGMSITINAPGATAETVSMIRRVLAEATPGLLNAAQNQTIRSINRPRLNGT